MTQEQKPVLTAGEIAVYAEVDFYETIITKNTLFYPKEQKDKEIEDIIEDIIKCQKPIKCADKRSLCWLCGLKRKLIKRLRRK